MKWMYTSEMEMKGSRPKEVVKRKIRHSNIDLKKVQSKKLRGAEREK